MSCDQFKEGRERVISKKFEIISDSVKINCDELIMMKEKISKVKFFKNGSFFKLVSGFEIQGAKQCPSLSFDIKKEKVHLMVTFKVSKKPSRCDLVKRKVICKKK